jgi:hypothetical protein
VWSAPACDCEDTFYNACDELKEGVQIVSTNMALTVIGSHGL